MKKINVIVKDQYTLVLQEDAKTGDYIDLQSLQTVDTRGIIELINENKDKEYNKQLQNKIAELKLEKDNAIKDSKLDSEKTISELKATISRLETELKSKEENLNNEFNLKLSTALSKKNDESNKIEVQYTKDYQTMKNSLENKNLELQKKIDELNKTLDLQIKVKQQEFEKNAESLKLKYQTEISKLTSELTSKDDKFKIQLNEELSKLKESSSKEKESLIKTYSDEKDVLKDALNKQIDELKEENNQLKLFKSGKNVKQTGEDLESWCDNTVNSYMQNGLFNCEWIKDNKVIKEEDEAKGTKADYIMNVYESDARQYLLTNICFDMKDENPLSTNKKKNKDYFPALDKNRLKKNCKYAVLVSNLETEKPNDLPIYKVTDPLYKDMYVVRPQYLMVFINLIVSLTVRFKDLVLKEKKENAEFSKQEELVKKFEEMKNTYLDKPLESLSTKVETILSQADVLTKATDKIRENANKIITSYINEIEKKLSRFNIHKIGKGLQELEDSKE